MNWQALNPLRLVSASKDGVAALWKRRPSLSKRTVAWGTAISMLCCGGGYYGYQKLRPGRATTVATANSNVNDVDGEKDAVLKPIRDLQEGGPDPQVQQVADTQDPGSTHVGEQANGGPGADSGMTNGDGTSFGSGRPGMFVGTSTPVSESSGRHGTETGAIADAGPQPEGSPYEGQDQTGQMAAEQGNDGKALAGQATEGQMVGGGASGSEVDPQSGPTNTQDESAPEPPIAVVENERPRVLGVRQGLVGSVPESDVEGRNSANGSSIPNGDVPSTGVPSTPDEREARPLASPSAVTEATPDLVPVPTRPQPSPPEEHVRLPAEAAPDLTPRRGMNGMGASGAALGAGSAATPRTFGGSMAPPPPPPGADGSSLSGTSSPSGSMGRPIPGSSGSARDVESNPFPRSNSGFSSEPSRLPEGTGGIAMPLAASPTPGAKHLEGPQSPSLEMEKIAPDEVQVGRPARFEIKVRNVGRVAAQNISIVDQVPQGTRLIDANPPCQRGTDGSLRWNVGALGPGQETSIVLQLLPEQEGEIGSVAQVIFHSQAAVRTVATRPQIRIEHSSMERALIGDQVKVRLAVINRGSGATSNLVLEATLPENLAHPAGAELEYPIGALRPGETKQIELTLKAVRAGAAPCGFVAREESQVMAEERSSMEIVAPQLQVGVNGPKVRYLDRQATYSVAIANPGTAPATNLELVVHLPRGLKFVSADNQGQYDAQRHAVLWGLAELPAGVMGASQLVVVPTEPGEQRIRAEAKADLRLEHVSEQPVFVETLSELQFSVVDAADPIEVGSEASYEIVVQNRGSRAATNVRVAVEFPAELTPVAGDGPTGIQVRGQQLVIEPLPRLAPNSQVAYQIRAKGVRKGDPRIRVLVASDESPTPVTKEESTRVYADE